MDLTFKAKILPIDLITSKQQDLISVVRAAIHEPSMREAGFAALTTLVRLEPGSVMAELVSQIEADTPFDDLRALSSDELGMWRTEPGTLYIDVLSTTKKDAIEKNNKNAKMEQWEAELRADIAKKKAAQNKALTKDQKAAVDAQAKIEALSCLKTLKKFHDSDDEHFKTRAIIIKEQRAEEVKHHLMVLWADFFTKDHFEQFPNLHQLFWDGVHGAGDVKKSTDVAVAEKLLKTIDEISDIFWQTDKAKDMGVYPPA